MREIGDIEYAENNNQSEFAYEYTNILQWWHLSYTLTYLTYPSHVFLEYPSVFTLSIKIFLLLPSSPPHPQGIWLKFSSN